MSETIIDQILDAAESLAGSAALGQQSGMEAARTRLASLAARAHEAECIVGGANPEGELGWRLRQSVLWWRTTSGLYGQDSGDADRAWVELLKLFREANAADRLARAADWTGARPDMFDSLSTDPDVVEYHEAIAEWKESRNVHGE